MSKKTRVMTLTPSRRRSNLGGRCALPVCAALAVLALGAGAAFADRATGKFCGYDLTGKDPKWGNIAYLHNQLDFQKQYEGYVRRPGGINGYTGFILWGHTQKEGFTPLYFVPQNVPTDEC